MPQLLLEIFSEEIPARMQAKAAADLERALMDRFTAAGLIPEGIKAFAGPRRITAVVEGLPVKSKDVVEDVVGPKEGAPEAAIQGFLKKAGLTSIDQAHVHEVPKKGRVYVAHVRKEGRETASLIAEAVPQIIRDFHWPKSMRWGSGDLRWVRPIQRILCTFDGEIVPFEVEGIRSSNVTEGHRVMGRGPFTVRRFEDYEDVLKNKGFVILDREERKEIILHEARTLCQAQGLELVEDIGLLEEVAGLAEWPTVLIGDMDPAFLDLPPEVIKLSMRTHQKYFAVRDPAKGEMVLAPKFIVVANLVASDGGAKIAAGNSRVLSARLNDARFFWDNDRKVSLDVWLKKLESVVFHSNPRLGSVRAKAERISNVADRLAKLLHFDPVLAKQAGLLCKADLVSDMVGEFPELEGTMGRYYALQKDIQPEIADAVRDHYRPKGPADMVPTAPISIAVALADKFDTLAGFWSVDEKPTGSKDPFALRRAALGIVRIILENQLRLPLLQALIKPFSGVQAHILVSEHVEVQAQVQSWFDRGLITEAQANRLLEENFELSQQRREYAATGDVDRVFGIAQDLLAFFADRLKVHLREQGARHDLIDAVFALGEDDLVLIVKRVEALGAFLSTDDGKNLLAGVKRAANILKAEEKKGGETFSGAVAASLLEQDEEKALHAALAKLVPAAEAAIKSEDFEGAMKALAELRAPVDAFFDKVTVNADVAALRENRLKLVAQVRDAAGRVADFGKIEG